MGKTTFSGPVRSLAGFNPSGYANVVNLPEDGSYDLTSELHGGRIVTLTGAATTVLTLPAINGTDPVDETTPGQVSNFGLSFRVMLSDSVTSLTVGTTGTDEFFGGLTIDTESVATLAASGNTFFAQDGDGLDTITITSAATGWEPGGVLEFVAINKDVSGSDVFRWCLTGSKLLGIGTVTTPLSAS
jgi:hypothetical protein